MPMEDTQWKPGQSGNPAGRPKDTMKDFMRRRFKLMTDDEKEAFLKLVPAAEQIRLAEGNPHQTSDNTTEVTIPKPLLNALRDNNSNPQDSGDAEENQSDSGGDVSG